MSTNPTSLSQSPNRLLAVAFGIAYLLIGLFGFFVSTSVPFATTEGRVLIGLFGMNPLLSLISLAIGAILLISGLVGARSSKSFNMIFGIGLIALGFFGLFGDHTSANIVALNAADQVLHFATGVVMVIVALAADAIARKPVAA